MTIDETRAFFRTFYCESLTCSEINEKARMNFSSEIRNNNLVNYLKGGAWKDDADRLTRVYVIKDKAGKMGK